MPLGQCPDCEGNVSSSAAFCPHCGYAVGKTLKTAIYDVRMPFGSMVVFMVQWAIAAIPALIILTVLGFVVFAILLTIMGR